MKKISSLLLLIAFVVTGNHAQTITVREAKEKSMGTQVTVAGIVTCDVIGNSSIRYFQDATAGIAVYSADFATAVTKGDSITITGTLKDYKGVIELDPVANFTVHSSGNDLPAPLIIKPSQQHDSIQGMLVHVKRAIFEDAGKTFSSGTYNYTASDETGVIYVHAYSPLNGQQVPTFPANMTGIASTFGDNPQILVRDMDDFESTSSIWLTSPLTADNITKEGFTLSWTTNINGSTQLVYGNTPELELPPIDGTGNTTEHSIQVSGAEASDLIYAKAFSVAGEDTAWSVLKVYVTKSNSSGDMKVYFNRTVDHAVSSGTDAIQLFHAIDDTLVQYINRTKHTIDFTIYNYNTTEIADITGALNAAHGRGIEVRVVNDNNLADNAGWEALDHDIGKITSPPSDYLEGIGIMHNKFVVFDALSTDPDDAIVWTGSTNFTTGQINSDPNNVIIIHDQSLAKTYRLEFEEMFGSSGLQPDNANAKFGSYKKDNTPHEFVIGGKRVECYFSPSDGVNQVIARTIRTADYELYVNTMLITRDSLAQPILDRDKEGVKTQVIVNSEGQSDEQNVLSILKQLDENFRTNGEGAILHHKTMIADQGHGDSDPLVLTGCHNWSNSADTRNDENTLIVHDATIANIYYQEFNERFKNGKIVADVPVAKNDYQSMKQGDTLRHNVLDNDEITGSVNVSITWGPVYGEAEIESDGLVTYIPDPSFTGLDTMVYKVCSEANDAFCDSAKLIVLVEEPSQIHNKEGHAGIYLYPNPNSGEFILYNHSSESKLNIIELFSMSGKRVYSSRLMLQQGSNQISLPDSLKKGLYIIRIRHAGSVTQLKLLLQ